MFKEVVKCYENCFGWIFVLTHKKYSTLQQTMPKVPMIKCMRYRLFVGTGACEAKSGNRSWKQKEKNNAFEKKSWEIIETPSWM